MIKYVLPMLTAAVLATATAKAAPAPELQVDGDPHAGHLTLTWSSEQPKKVYQLQESPTEAFERPTLRYEGAHTSSVRSGLRDGVRFFRVRYQLDAGAGWSPWSAPVRFKVEHYTRTFALGLCALGALVFGCTLAFLLGASRRVRD